MHKTEQQQKTNKQTKKNLRDDHVGYRVRTECILNYKKLKEK